MPVTYTNRKGSTYYLCRGRTKTGKPRYYFAREPGDEPVAKIPEGWEIRESVNGVVTLAKKRPAQILPAERKAVEAALERHPQSGNYRVDVKDKHILVYERVGAGLDALMPMLERAGILAGGKLGELQEVLDRGARFSPVMRFILCVADGEKRLFGVQRWCYRGSIDDWIDLSQFGPIDKLAPRLIPVLGTDDFYELM